MVPKRKEADIKEITIWPQHSDTKMWGVVLDYKDGMSAALWVDGSENMLEKTFNAIKRQLKGGKL